MNTFYRILKRCMAGAACSAPLLLSAQVHTYEFTESVGTYTEISEADGGVGLGIPTYWPHVNNNRAWVNNPFNDPDGQVTMNGYLAPAMGPGYPIGFDFTFNGDVFDVIGISNGGWISFGKSSDGLQAVWVYNWSGTGNGDPLRQAYNNPQPDYKRNRVAGFGNSSLQQVDWTSLAPPGQYSTLRMATIGTAPNRVCVIQWKDYGLRNDITVAMNKINFQIRLNEIDNTVDVVFGPQDWVSSAGRYRNTQIGLGGRTEADFNGRMTVYEEPAFLYDWNMTVPMINSQDNCQYTAPQPFQPNGSGIPPVEGLTWRWTPAVCPPPAWPLTLGDISYDAASVSWEALVAGEYEYILTDTNDVNGPEISSGTTTDPEIFFFGLDPLTDYYLFIRQLCDDGPGPWSMSTHFRTIGGGVVACDGTAIEVDYCSHQHDTIYWLYQSTDGSPLKIEFLNGFISTNTADHFRIWNSAQIPPAGAADWSMPTGNPAGLVHQSPNGTMLLQLVTEQGSCASQDWFLPFEWRIGCKNCTDPLVSFNAVEDCANQEYSVEVNVFSMGSATSLDLNNTLGIAPTTVSATGVHVVGPFPAGQSVMITAQNTENVMCRAESPLLIGQPCVLVDCGPTLYTYCYGDNEQRQWAYQGEDDQEIGIRFLRGTMGLGDQGRVYNGIDLDFVVPESLPTFGSLMNRLYTSGPPSTDRALVLELASDDENSCADGGPVFDPSQEWEYVVACYDGCTQPQASFTRTCLNADEYEVVVNITQVGSEGATITNDGGAAPVTVTGIGEYTVGPFASASTVTLEVEGSSILCTWTSAPQTIDCAGVGISELGHSSMSVFPNPSSGAFRVEFARAMPGQVDLTVLDLAGRAVHGQRIDGAAAATLELGHLPAGLYTLVAQGTSNRITAQISIQH